MWKEWCYRELLYWLLLQRFCFISHRPRRRYIAIRHTTALLGPAMPQSANKHAEWRAEQSSAMTQFRPSDGSCLALPEKDVYPFISEILWPTKRFPFLLSSKLEIKSLPEQNHPPTNCFPLSDADCWKMWLNQIDGSEWTRTKANLGWETPAAEVTEWTLTEMAGRAKTLLFVTILRTFADISSTALFQYRFFNTEPFLFSSPLLSSWSWVVRWWWNYFVRRYCNRNFFIKFRYYINLLL